MVIITSFLDLYKLDKDVYQISQQINEGHFDKIVHNK